MHLLLRALYTFALLLFIPLGYAAEVFNCTDAHGRAVFSETPCPDTAVKERTLPQQVFHQLRELVNAGEKINAELKGDVESLKVCNRDVAELKKRIEAVKADVEKVALEHRFLYAAYDQLQECAQCRVSAITYCKKADNYLDKSMNGLIGKRKAKL